MVALTIGSYAFLVRIAKVWGHNTVDESELWGLMKHGSARDGAVP